MPASYNAATVVQSNPLNRVFISYEDKTGLPLATSIRTALLKEHVQAWVWAIDHPSGYVFREIAERIGEADYICWVCTKGTPASEGQEWEIDNAFGQRKTKRSWVVAPDVSHVPRVLMGYYRYDPLALSVDDLVKHWVGQCRAGFPGWPTVVEDVAASNQPEGGAISPTRLVGEDE